MSLHERVLGRIRQEFSRKGIAGVANAAVRLVGVGLQFKAHRELVSVIAGASTSPILEIFPRVSYRYTLPYLSTSISRERRLRMLKGHYQFINDNLKPAFFSRVLSRSLLLWASQVEGANVSIDIGGPCLVTRHREGDLTAYMKVDGRTVGKVGFSIVPVSALTAPPPAWPSAGTHVLFIGQVQGEPGCYELIRSVTKSCLDISPLDLLMSAMAGVSMALGAGFLVGVSQENNISFNDSTISVSAGYFNYNDFWFRYGGLRNSDGDYWIRIPYDEKAIGLISSNHRRRTLRKRAFKNDVANGAQAVIENLSSRSPVQ